ncbi:MAG TPA: DUF5362 family protein [Puia sp.]|nr:DUF5362 family protein [Puia sp.]
MENLSQPPGEISLFELQIDTDVTTYLRESARWAKFVAIIGYICCGFILLLLLLAAGAAVKNNPGAEQWNVLVGAIFFILIIPIVFFPCLYLYKFASRMQAALHSNDQEQLIRSFRSLKSCYRFVGILMLIYLGLTVLLFIFNVFGKVAR